MTTTNEMLQDKILKKEKSQQRVVVIGGEVVAFITKCNPL
jgi:hypothetical protein